MIEIPERILAMKNWTLPHPNIIHTYRLWNLTALHDRLAAHLNQLLVDVTHPEWQTRPDSLKGPPEGSSPYPTDT